MPKTIPKLIIKHNPTINCTRFDQISPVNLNEPKWINMSQIASKLNWTKPIAPTCFKLSFEYNPIVGYAKFC